MLRYGLMLALLLLAAPVTMAARDPPLTLEVKIPLGNISGRIDHLAVDLKRKRLFIAELGNDSLGAVDLAGGKLQSTTLGLKEPQGIAFDAATDAVFVANAGDGSVRSLRAEDLTPLGRLDLGDDADNVRLAPRGRVLVGYGAGALAVIDAARRTKIADIPLKAHPESFQLTSDGSRAFVNVPDAGEIQLVDLAKGAAIGNLPTRTYGANFPMALDDRGQRLAVVFRNPARLVMYRTADHSVVADVATCGDADDVFFDAKRQRLYVICGAGVVDIFDIQGASLAHRGQVITASGARTGLFVPELDRLYVAARAGWTEPAALLVYQPVE